MRRANRSLIAKAIEAEDDKVSNAEDFDYEYSFEFHYADCARAVLTALSTAGFVVVPRERTSKPLDHRALSQISHLNLVEVHQA